MERQVEEGLISPELRDKISFVLLRKHRHQTKKPIHRSLADIGKSNSSSEFPVCQSWTLQPVCVLVYRLSDSLHVVFDMQLERQM